MDEARKATIYCQIEEFNTEINDHGLSDAYEKWYGQKVGKYSNKSTFDCSESINKVQKLYNDINDIYEIKCLYHDIKMNFDFFDDVIDFYGLIHPFFVEPSINNERLQAQDGFFLFEPYKNQTDIKEIHNDVVNKLSIDHTEEGMKITIPSKYKNRILTELDFYCGINKAKLFPDSENIASYISNEFSNTN